MLTKIIFDFKIKPVLQCHWIAYLTTGERSWSWNTFKNGQCLFEKTTSYSKEPISCWKRKALFRKTIDCYERQSADPHITKEQYESTFKNQWRTECKYLNDHPCGVPTCWGLKCVCFTAHVLVSADNNNYLTFQLSKQRFPHFPQSNFHNTFNSNILYL